MTISINRARIEDVKWLAQAQIAMARETEELELDPETVTHGVREVFDHPDRGWYYVARNGSNAPVGCLLVQLEWSDWRNADLWWAHSVYVPPEERGQGVYRIMYKSVRQEAIAAGAKGIRLYMDRNNTRARGVYLRMGMTADHYDVFEDMFEE